MNQARIAALRPWCVLSFGEATATSSVCMLSDRLDVSFVHRPVFLFHCVFLFLYID